MNLLMLKRVKSDIKHFLSIRFLFFFLKYSKIRLYLRDGNFYFTQKQKMLNVRQFVYENITPYEGDASFLCGPTEKTKNLWKK